jgi:hypothetical protein
MLQAAGLAREQLEVVIKPRARAELAVQAPMPRDDTATVVDRDLPGTDTRTDLQAGERDRDRIAVLTDRDQRLLINPGCRGLAGIKRLGGQRNQQRPLDLPCLTDRLTAPVDPPAEIAFAAGEQYRVELVEIRDARDRHQVISPAAAHFAFDTALLMRALDARRR